MHTNQQIFRLFNDETGLFLAFSILTDAHYGCFVGNACTKRKLWITEAQKRVLKDFKAELQGENRHQYHRVKLSKDFAIYTGNPDVAALVEAANKPGFRDRLQYFATVWM